MIDRKALVNRHNPKLTAVETESPLTVGNGEFAFTADVTGFQSLYREYTLPPLCTMSVWGWHSEGNGYTQGDVEMTHYTCGGRHFDYAVDCKPGNETIYNWLRQNPHRLNLARIELVWQGCEIQPEDMSDIEQELDLYTGLLHSRFTLHGYPVEVVTVCAQNADALGFSLSSPALDEGSLRVKLSFPFGSHKISASDWESENRHSTDMFTCEDGCALKRTLDNTSYYAAAFGSITAERTGAHEITLNPVGGKMDFAVSFSPESLPQPMTFDKICASSIDGWAEFWHNGGIADFSGCKDARAPELERRMILSMYLMAVNSAGSMPPQETGLTCNSWYGKFHLEMHILHSGWLPLWGRGALLEKSFGWYEHILDNARANAKRNGFAGARWPKMVGPGGIDSPSRIATLLIWQQPHILYMLELRRGEKPDPEGFMRRYWPLVRETADFMADFAREDNGVFNLPPPLIPAQEEHAPEVTRNPVFELCYWDFGLGLAIQWAKELGEPYEAWENVRRKLAKPASADGLYLAHENCPDTFTAFNRDHPSMLYGYGFIPCDSIDSEMMERTLDRVLECWNFSSLWGWDFALMAMTLTRLGKPEAAIDILLRDTVKNSFVKSGNNFQRGRSDLPLYLPGNGSLLLALAMMLAGYGDTRDKPGFPSNGMWVLEYEGIRPLPQ